MKQEIDKEQGLSLFKFQYTVIEPMSDKKIVEIMNEEMEERRKNRYKQYLKLKEEFEN